MLSGGNQGCKSDLHAASLCRRPGCVVCATSLLLVWARARVPMSSRQLLCLLGTLHSSGLGFHCFFTSEGGTVNVSLSLSLAHQSFKTTCGQLELQFAFIAKCSSHSGGPGCTLAILQQARTRRRGQRFCHSGAGGAGARAGSETIAGSARSGLRVHKMSPRPYRKPTPGSPHVWPDLGPNPSFLVLPCVMKSTRAIPVDPGRPTGETGKRTKCEKTRLRNGG